MATTIKGTSAADVISATKGSVNVSGLGGDDKIFLGAGDDTAYGGKGSDTILGGAGNDRLFGDDPGEVSFKTDLLTMAEDYKIKVTFDFEEAGYQNTLGVYKVNPKTGAFEDVKVMWENASLKGSGGDLVGGKTTFEYAVSKGDQVGFFLVGNGFASNSFAKLGPGSFAFLDAANKPGNVNAAGSKLAHISSTGKMTVLNGPVYHTAAFAGRAKLNSDGIEHTMGYKRSDDGSFQIGFEDLWKGGDRDFDDAVFTVDIGKASVEVLNKHYETVLKPATVGVDIKAGSYMAESVANDRIFGQTGADSIEGNQGNDLIAGGGAGAEWRLVNGKWVFNPAAIKKTAGLVFDQSDDTLQGGTGDDVLLGGRGNDRMFGGDGNDTLNAGKGQDAVYGGAGKDTLNLEDDDDLGDGGDGDDIINAGAGNDRAFGGAGADSLRGGDGNDTLSGDAGADDLQGGAGADSLDGGADDDKVFGGAGDDVARGGAGADYVEGGDGHDRLFGDDGDDRLIGGSGADSMVGGAGKDTLVGGADSDRLEGGAGDDQLWGGNWSADGARDVFVHAPGAGRDQVNDFELKHDQIDLSAYGLSYKDLAGRITDKGWATEIDLSGLNGAGKGDVLVLKAIKASDLSASHFIL